MTLAVHIPDELSARLEAACGNLGTALLEGFAIESYRQGRISTAEVGRLLGHASRWQTEDFLATHQAWPGTTSDEALGDLAALRGVRR